jgi:hypothetical protein
VYVNGNITYTGNAFIAYNSIPANLRIYQIGPNRTFLVTSNVGALVASISSPRADFISDTALKFYGDMVFSTISVKNNSEFYYDETLGTGRNTSIVK